MQTLQIQKSLYDTSTHALQAEFMSTSNVTYPLALDATYAQKINAKKTSVTGVAVPTATGVAVHKYNIIYDLLACFVTCAALVCGPSPAGASWSQIG